MGIIRLIVVMIQCCQSAGSPATTFSHISSQYVRAYWDHHPIAASVAGLHQYDGVLPDLSLENLDRWLVLNKTTLRQLLEMPSDKLRPNEVIDREILKAQCGKVVFELENHRTQHINPDFYNVVSAGLLGCIRRDFAPVATRMDRATDLLRGVPTILEHARANLDTVMPKAVLEVAIDNIEGAISFYKEDVHRAFSDVADPQRQSALQAASARAAKATALFVEHLRAEAMPRADNKFALGRARYEQMLAATEGITVSVDRLLEIGERDLASHLARVKEIASHHFGGISPESLMARMSSSTYSEDKLISGIAGELETIRSYILEHDIISIPSEDRPIVSETPPFMRWGFAFLSAPGPYEVLAPQAYYDVTPVEAHWSEQQKREWLAVFNKYVATNTSVHEAYPGHFLEHLHTRLAPTDVQKVFQSYAAVEGWAHYCEMLMIEQGWGRQDPMFEVGMLQDALLRSSRLVCSIKMHCFGMTVDEATRFFMDHTFYGQHPAHKEAIRGTFDPGYLFYTVGKLQIAKLREDYRRRHGSSFDLRAFHDNLLSHGMPPLVVTRTRMLGPESGPSL